MLALHNTKQKLSSIAESSNEDALSDMPDIESSLTQQNNDLEVEENGANTITNLSSVDHG